VRGAARKGGPYRDTFFGGGTCLWQVMILVRACFGPAFFCFFRLSYNGDSQCTTQGVEDQRMRDPSEEFSVHLARSAGTVRMNCRQWLNANNRRPSGFIAFLSRSLRNSQPLWRLSACC